MRADPKYLIVKTHRDGQPIMEIVTVRRTDDTIQKYIDSPDMSVYFVGPKIPRGTRITQNGNT